MSETQNNIIRFNYSVDPTTLMSNSWITTNTDTTQNTVTGIDPTTVTHYWRTITFDFSGKSAYAGVFRIEVNYKGQLVQPYNFESISGDSVTNVTYSDDNLLFEGDGGGMLSNFSTATENTVYTETEVTGTWSYINGTSTETDYNHYEVELYVNSDVTTFPNNLFYNDVNITSVEFDTYSITSIEDGEEDGPGAFSDCLNLASVILPNNLEYIGDFAFATTHISQITLPSTLNEIGVLALRIGNLSITSLAIAPPTLHTRAIDTTTTLTIHETSLQSYINSDWGNYVTSIDTIETPTYNNVLKFNYSTDLTTLLKNMWVNSCTDNEANTIEPVGEKEVEVTKHWRDVTYSNSGGDSGTVRVGWENSAYTNEFEVIIYEGLEPTRVIMSKGTLQISGATGAKAIQIAGFENFSTAAENQEYSFSFKSGETVTGTISYTNATTTETVTTYDHYEVTLYINSALNTFETTMFADDDNITSIEFDYNVTSIIDDAFNGCENLLSVTLTSTVPPTIGEDTFSGLADDVVLYVPNGAQGIYRSEFGDIFSEIRAIDEPPVRGYGFNLNDMLDVDYMEQYRRR